MLLTFTEFIGRFHPVLVHLPIGFLLVGLMMQWLSSKPKYNVSLQVTGVVMFAGMFAAIVSCITGYFLSLSGDYEEGTISWHMWMGIAVAAISILLYAKIYHRQVDAWHRVLSVTLLMVILLTGHLGGSLTHGANYLTEAWSQSPDSISIIQKPIPNIQEANVFVDVVQPLLQTKCYSCHGDRKQKGSLRLDAPEFILKGGKNGAVIDSAGNESELVKRLLLPREDEDHMPPKQKPQLNEGQVAIIHWWVEQGANFNKKVKELKQPEIIKPYLLALQSDHKEEKKAIPAIPPAPVDKADEKLYDALKQKGVIIIPVSRNSNYLMANFISAVAVTDRDIAVLQSVQKQLVWLKLNNVGITDSALSIIGKCTNLTALQLNSTKITDKGLGYLKNLQKLQSLSITGTPVTTDGVLQLRPLKSLKSVYLYQTAVNKKDWGKLKSAFPATAIDTGGYFVPLLSADTSLAKPPGIVK